MKIIHIVIAISLVSVVFAHEDIALPEDIVSRILAKQSVTSISQLYCSKVSQEDFEELGDSVMERMAGSHQMHDQMDNMMGGEGSTSLQQIHIAMGGNWLGCTKAEGVMGGTVNVNMMPMMMRMMGNYYPAYYSGYDFVFLLALAGWLLFFIAVFYLYSIKRKISKKRH